MSTIAQGAVPKKVTRLRTAVVALLLANAIAWAVHDGRAADPASLEGAPEPSAAGAPGAPTGAPTLPTVPPRKAKADAKQQKSGGTTTTLPALPPDKNLGDYTFEVTISARCARPAEQLTITMKLKPNAGGVLMGAYSDGASNGTLWSGFAPADTGTVTYTWWVPPVPGPASVTTAANDPEADPARGGRTTVYFNVVEAGTKC